jgi:hypothetical protein
MRHFTALITALALTAGLAGAQSGTLEKIFSGVWFMTGDAHEWK